MDSKERHNLRLAVLAGFLALVVLIYVGVLYDTQVVNYDKYIAQSIRSIAREEKVAASRGIITDRTGRALVTSRSTYNLTFDASLLKADEDENEAILRLVKLCQANGVAWTDNLPITQEAPHLPNTTWSCSLMTPSLFWSTYFKSPGLVLAFTFAELSTSAASLKNPMH